MLVGRWNAAVGPASLDVCSSRPEDGWMVDEPRESRLGRFVVYGDGVGKGARPRGTSLEDSLMLQMTDPCLDESVDEIASQALGLLYTDVWGEEPLALRAHRDGDGLLLLLRFDPELMESAGGTSFEPLVDRSFIALPELVAEAVRVRTAQTLVPRNVNVSAERGLAVFAFST
jgi:hypothetical protein